MLEALFHGMRGDDADYRGYGEMTQLDYLQHWVLEIPDAPVMCADYLCVIV